MDSLTVQVQEYARRPRLLFVLHDYMLQPPPERFLKWDRDPQTVKEYRDDGIPVTPAMDGYMRGVIGLFSPGLPRWRFESFYRSLMAGDRAFTNKHGIESDDWKWETLICAGATVQAVSDHAEGGWREVYAINAARVPPIPARWQDVDMVLHFRPTTFTHDLLPDGTYRVGSFPQFNDRTVLPIWAKNADTVLLPASRLVPVESILNPFHPAFDP